MLEIGGYATIREIANAEKINESYVGRVLRLTLLAPDIVEAVLGGRQPAAMQLEGLLRRFPVEWRQQRGDIPRLTPIVRTTRSTASFTKPQAPSAALTGIPPNGRGPARYPSGLVCPAARGSLRRRQCADQLRHLRQLRLAGGTAR